jgi:hypothetical protein
MGLEATDGLDEGELITTINAGGRSMSADGTAGCP